MNMQTWVTELTGRLEEIAYDDDYSAMLDWAEGLAGIGYRENSAGEYESAHVLMTFQPTIKLDTATGEIYCYFYSDHGSAFLSEVARRYINEFFRTIHDC